MHGGGGGGGGGEAGASSEEARYLFKVVVVGSGSVGKSNIILRRARNEFHTDQKTTIGLDVVKSYAALPGTKDRAVLQLWDTAGQERFRAMTKSYYAKAHGCLLVYDITQRQGFDELGKWLDEVQRYSDNPDCVLMLVGNKLDLQHARVVTRAEASKFAQVHNMTFFETSARDNEHIDDVFEALAAEMYRRQTAAGGHAPVNNDKPLAGASMSRGQLVTIDQGGSAGRSARGARSASDDGHVLTAGGKGGRRCFCGK